jgi:hypothetical protein
MGSMSEVETSGTAKAVSGGPEQFVCDFCARTVPRVRRIAIDGDYERLRTPHQVQYACETCSEDKERRRLGLDRG